ncbi:MAG: 50S ribosomal protein L34 [Candidatus Goldiibacteriota bacterium]
MSKRTFQPHKTKTKKKQGFLKKMSENGGQNVIKSRRKKGRKKLTTV